MTLYAFISFLMRYMDQKGFFYGGNMKAKLTLRIIAEITIMSALAFTLDYVQGLITGGLFPNGGSIGIAMLPILIISYRRGFIAGMVTGLLVSVLQMIPGNLSLIPVESLPLIICQVMLDYVIAYPLIGVAGAFARKYKDAKNNKLKVTFLIAGTLVGGLLKLLVHHLAGAIFWREYLPTDFFGGPDVYSILYNSGYMIPNIIINGALLILIALKAPMLLKTEENK